MQKFEIDVLGMSEIRREGDRIIQTKEKIYSATMEKREDKKG